MFVTRKMAQFRKVFISGLMVMLFMSLTTGIALAQDPERGKVLWEEETSCQQCHGPAGEGKWAGPLAGHDHTAEEWIEQVRNPRQRMPTFSEAQVSDEMIIDIHAYLSSLPEVEGFSPMDAGLADDAPEGQQLLVEKRCAACHTTEGPLKGFQSREETPTAEAVISQLRSPARFMPSYNEDQVSDEEAALIADFLASQLAAEMSDGGEMDDDSNSETMAEATPETLPQSGGNQPFNQAVVLFGGLILLIGGFGLRHLMNQPV